MLTISQDFVFDFFYQINVIIKHTMFCKKLFLLHHKMNARKKIEIFFKKIIPTLKLFWSSEDLVIYNLPLGMYPHPFNAVNEFSKKSKSKIQSEL
jgi:hypothetical protein